MYKQVTPAGTEFTEGVKYIRDFAVHLSCSKVNYERLDNLSSTAKEHFSRAVEYIKTCTSKVELQTCIMMKQRKILEETIKDEESKIDTLEKSIELKLTSVKKAEMEINNAKDQIRNINRDIDAAWSKKEEAKCATVVVSGLTGLLAGAAVIASGGLAAPGVAAIATWGGSTVAGVAVISDKNNDLDNARLRLRAKEIEHETLSKEMLSLKEELNSVKNKLISTKGSLKCLVEKHINLMQELKCLTTLQECILKCTFYFEVTVGKVEVLYERRKIPQYLLSLNKAVKDVSEHLHKISNEKALQGWANQVISIVNEIQTVTLKSICDKDSSDLNDYL